MEEASRKLEAAIHCYALNCAAFGRARDAGALRALDAAFQSLREIQRADWPDLAADMSALGVSASDLVNAWLAEEDADVAAAAHESGLLGFVERMDEVLSTFASASTALLLRHTPAAMQA